MVTSQSLSIDYTYNSDGIRTKRVIESTNVYDYILDGTKILCETLTSNGTEQYKYHYLYDEKGSIIGFQDGTATYYYQKNLQGDIIRILNTEGVVLVEYTYNAFGEVLSVTGSHASTLGQRNPFRYRGYYYDKETGFYYLNSRYYDPTVGRFLNMGELTDIDVNSNFLGGNLFAYCNNNPIILSFSNVGLVPNTLGSILAIKTEAFDPSIVFQVLYDVPLYDQNGYYLCWAFCQVMIEDYRAGIIRTNEQATERAIEISRSIYGDEWNQGGWPTHSVDDKGEPIYINYIKFIDDLYNELVKSGPIYGYYWNSDTHRAHLVVITGVDLTNGLVYTNNPWGVAGEQTFDDFLAGFAWTQTKTYREIPFNAYVFIN